MAKKKPEETVAPVVSKPFKKADWIKEAIAKNPLMTNKEIATLLNERAKKEGVTLSKDFDNVQVSIYRKDKGTRKAKDTGTTGVVTIVELQAVKELDADTLEETLSQLEAVEEKFGSLERAREAILAYRELVK